MASHGGSGTVRSHRRGGRRRSVPVAPWLIAATVVVLLAGGVTAAVALVASNGCSGRQEAIVVVTPRIETIMQQLNTAWAATEPSVDGTCVSVTVSGRDSAEVSAALAGEWDPKANGPTPDVWVPDASAWVRKASVDADAERIIPDLQPSLARTPTVIAMPREMAQAAGMVRTPLTWRQIVNKLNRPGGWAAYEREEWGPFKVGLSDPQESTAGLLALMAISDIDDSGDVSEEEQAILFELKKVVSVTAKSSTDIFNGLQQAAAESPAGPLEYVSAFPALEQDVLAYNMTRPSVPLQAVYPKDGTAEADFPYLILNAAWAQVKRQEVAAEFLTYVRGPAGKAAFQEVGLRDANRAPGPNLTSANGVAQKVTALPRAILLPESVQHATASWTAVTRPTNVLIVFDTSGSMGGPVPGTRRSRLDLTKDAALNAVSLLDDSARVGVWEFSTNDGRRDHRPIEPLAPLGSTGHRADVNRTITSLDAGGNTGLYNTALAACKEVQRRYAKGAANLILLLTDGADDNNIANTISLGELTRSLRGSCGGESKPVQLVTIGLGVDSDSGVLRQISGATSARSYSSPRTFDVSQVFLSALFS
jgi:Ca-activated chloride channel family protein